ncbi:MAG: endolytic transglycosylase MltG [Patescibacteria group bacterium]
MRKLRSLIIALLLVLAGSAFWYYRSLRPVDADDSVRRMVEIPQGSTVTRIGEILEEKGVIRSPLALRLSARFRGVQERMKAGTFVLRKSQSTAEIIGILARGHGEEASVTIPEGFTVRDIDALLAEQGIMEKGELTACAKACDFSSFAFLPSGEGQLDRGGKLEGYLFPDTYFIVKDEFVPKLFLERLLGTFRNRVAEGLADDLKGSRHSLHEIITMASLVEEETRTEEERPVVAGILWKRFGEGMMFGVDAAVRYAVNKPRGDITKDDLETDSPYNLRKVRGLPPGPIANPSLSSIKAALHPKETAYWYYLHDANGTIHYAVTNDEHNTNRAKYLR